MSAQEGNWHLYVPGTVLGTLDVSIHLIPSNLQGRFSSNASLQMRELRHMVVKQRPQTPGW